MTLVWAAGKLWLPKDASRDCKAAIILNCLSVNSAEKYISSSGMKVVEEILTLYVLTLLHMC